MIFVHEFGHFTAGKLMGLKVREFMFGLPGPRIFSFKRGETEYGMTTIPFGGYVRFAGLESELQTEEDEEDINTPPERKYDTQPRWKKAIIMLAGPAMNILFAVFLIALILMLQGTPDIENTIIGNVSKGTPAAKVGLKPGDQIISVAGKEVDSWTQAVDQLRVYPNKKIELKISRDNKTILLFPTLASKKAQGKNQKPVGFLGVSVASKRLWPHTALYQGLIATYEISKFMVVTLFVIFTQKIGLLVKGSAGPVGIVYESARIAQQSFWDYVNFLALICINIGIVNLLPIPPLDGGRLAILGIEGIKRGKLDQRLVYSINAVGMVLLLGLMVYFIFADFARIFANAPLGGGG